MPQEPGERWPTTRSLTYLATIFALRVTLNSSAGRYDRADFRSGEGRVATPEETTV
ncbi:MAG TPA: hypothetical protein VFH32_01060 [Rubrobacteraceae bacterium]|nr:hypothetical protein [Rubrobacteraceae bacterium]HEX4993225.1 hypothetical protein [Rubrobacteraceae bacterium]